MESGNGSPEHVTQILIDTTDRVIWIKDDRTMNNDNHTMFIQVPEGVNIFSLLVLQQPLDVKNISNWKVGISTEHLLFPNISSVLEVNLLLSAYILHEIMFPCFTDSDYFDNAKSKFFAEPSNIVATFAQLNKISLEVKYRGRSFEANQSAIDVNAIL